MDEYEEDELEDLFDDEYDEDDEEEQYTQTAIEKITGYTITHPRISLGGGSLITSGILDVFAHFNPTVAFLGVVASIAIGANGRDLLKDLIPGADQEAVHEAANQFADQILADYPEYVDQSAIAKVKRLFRVKEGKHTQTVLSSPQKQQDNTAGKGNKKGGLTLDRVLDLIEDGKLTDAQFFALIERLPNTNNSNDHDDEDPLSTVTRNGRNAQIIDATLAPEETVSTVTGNITPVTLPPGWTEGKVAMLPGFYRVFKDKDKSLIAIELSTSQRNRDFATEILKLAGLWKEGR